MSINRAALCCFAAGVALFGVGGIFHEAFPIVAPGIKQEFENTAVFRPWHGWTSTYMYLHPFGFGVIFAAVYLASLARGGIREGCRGGAIYGLLVFLVGSLPVYLLTYAAFQISSELAISWVVQSACQYIVAGAVLGWVTTPARSSATTTGEINPIR